MLISKSSFDPKAILDWIKWALSPATCSSRGVYLAFKWHKLKTIFSKKKSLPEFQIRTRIEFPTIWFVTSQNVWRGARDFTNWLVIFTDCFLSIINIMSLSNTIHEIVAQIDEIAAFTKRFNLWCISCHCFKALHLTKWKIVAPSVKSRQESIKPLHLPTEVLDFSTYYVTILMQFI